MRNELYKSCGTGTIKGGINLYIELQKHKLDQIAARNMNISIEKRKLHVSEEKYDTRDKNLSTVLANSSDGILPGPASQFRMVAGQQHAHSIRHILSLRNKYLETSHIS